MVDKTLEHKGYGPYARLFFTPLLGTVSAFATFFLSCRHLFSSIKEGAWLGFKQGFWSALTLPFNLPQKVHQQIVSKFTDESERWCFDSVVGAVFSRVLGRFSFEAYYGERYLPTRQRLIEAKYRAYRRDRDNEERRSNELQGASYNRELFPCMYEMLDYTEYLSTFAELKQNPSSEILFHTIQALPKQEIARPNFNREDIQDFKAALEEEKDDEQKKIKSRWIDYIQSICPCTLTNINKAHENDSPADLHEEFPDPLTIITRNENSTVTSITTYDFPSFTKYLEEEIKKGSSFLTDVFRRSLKGADFLRGFLPVSGEIQKVIENYRRKKSATRETTEPPQGSPSSPSFAKEGEEETHTAYMQQALSSSPVNSPLSSSESTAHLESSAADQRTKMYKARARKFFSSPPAPVPSTSGVEIPQVLPMIPPVENRCSK